MSQRTGRAHVLRQENSSSSAVRASKRLLLRPADFGPSRDDLKLSVRSIRARSMSKDKSSCSCASPSGRVKYAPGLSRVSRFANGSELQIDWVRQDEVEFIDPQWFVPRVGLRAVDLRVAPASRPTRWRPPRRGGRFLPREPWEAFGVEDPRITPIDDRFYFTYVAVSRHGAATALASTKDFQQFTRHGIIFPPENKDVVLFPERLHNQQMALHRPNGRTPFTASRRCDRPLQ